MKKKKQILIIGAGIHGCFIAKYLSESEHSITLIDKNKDICLETSAATHNRANRGFHYPRSKETTNECRLAYNYFNKNYKKFLRKIISFYCIEKKSKTNLSSYLNFFKSNKLKYEVIKNSKFIKKDEIEGIIRADEGCFNHKEIKAYLRNKIKKKNIKVFFNFNLKKVKKSGQQTLFISNDKIIKNKFDVIINATYNLSNETLKKFFSKIKVNKYKHQITEVVEIESKSKFPGITIMDGPYCTIMPKIGSKNTYLLYDVEHSIRQISQKPKINRFKSSNYLVMKKKIEKYLKFTNNFKFKNSLYGYRPIPINDKNADRSTKIIENNFYGTKIITIKEGKYISAPYMAKKLSKKIFKYLNAK
tara:strand:- start:1816 stop:2898 length:1083 start_codon:yes stop_codon:yes gene_type:complete